VTEEKKRTTIRAPGGRRFPKTPEEAASYCAWALHRLATKRMDVETAKTIVALSREYSRLYEMAALLKRIADLEQKLQLDVNE
jgi:hypothetical protein